MNKDQREIQRKLRILRHAEESGHVARTCLRGVAGNSRPGHPANLHDRPGCVRHRSVLFRFGDDPRYMGHRTFRGPARAEPDPALRAWKQRSRVCRHSVDSLWRSKSALLCLHVPARFWAVHVVGDTELCSSTCHAIRAPWSGQRLHSDCNLWHTPARCFGGGIGSGKLGSTNRIRFRYSRIYGIVPGRVLQRFARRPKLLEIVTGTRTRPE